MKVPMSLLLNISIRTRVIAAFALVLVVTGTLGLAASSWLADINRAANEVGTSWLPSTQFLGKLAMMSERYRATQGTALLSRGAEEGKEAQTRVQRTLADRNVAWQDYEK